VLKKHEKVLIFASVILKNQGQRWWTEIC